MSLYCPLEFAPAYFSVNCLLSLLSSCLSGLLRLPVTTMWRGPYRRRYMFCVLEVTLESLYHRLQCRTSALGTVLCSLSARSPFYRVRFHSCLLREERLLPVLILRYAVWTSFWHRSLLSAVCSRTSSRDLHSLSARSPVSPVCFGRCLLLADLFLLVPAPLPELGVSSNVPLSLLKCGTHILLSELHSLSATHSCLSGLLPRMIAPFAALVLFAAALPFLSWAFPLASLSHLLRCCTCAHSSVWRYSTSPLLLKDASAGPCSTYHCACLSCVAFCRSGSLPCSSAAFFGVVPAPFSASRLLLWAGTLSRCSLQASLLLPVPALRSSHLTLLQRHALSPLSFAPVQLWDSSVLPLLALLPLGHASMFSGCVGPRSPFR